MNMGFGANKTPVEVIKERAFGGTYFTDIYSKINGKWHKTSRKEFDELNNINQKYYCPRHDDVSVKKHGVKCEKSLRLWESKDCINFIDLYGFFQWYFERFWLGRRSLDDKRQITRW